MLLVLLVGTFYAPTTSNPLASDDYVLLDAASKGLGEAMRYQGGYHYIPLGMALLSLEHAIWGSDPVGYHWASIVLLALSGLLVVALGRALGFGEPTNWAAATLLTSSGLIHEIPLWACAVLHSASACLYVLALLAFLAHVRTGRRRYAVATPLLFVVAVLTHEQALSLPLAAALLLLVESRRWPKEEWSPRWHRAWTPMASLLVAGAGYAVTKLVLSDGTDLVPGLGSGLVSRVGASALHLIRVLIPNLSWQAAWQLLDPPFDGWSKHLARLAVVVAGAAIFALLPRVAKLLALWAAAHVVMMVAAIGMSSRHYLLPLIPASLLAGFVLERFADRLVTRSHRRSSGWLRAVLVTAFIVPVSAVGIATARSRSAVWADAGRVAERLLADALSAVDADSGTTTLYVVDLPDGLDLGESEPAYVFRFGFEVAFVWRMGDTAVPAIVRLRTENPPPRSEPFGRQVPESELATLAADSRNLVLRYDPERRNLVAMSR